jgi:hypothetical protein
MTTTQPGTTTSDDTSSTQTSVQESTQPPEPFHAPADYLDKSWTFKPDPGNAGSGASVQVPKGWAETARGTYWSDFLDPTAQVRLRADVTAGLTGEGTEQSAPDAAGVELDKLRGAAGFKLISRRTVPATEETGPGAVEIVYQFSRDGQIVQCTFRFVGVEAQMHARLGIYYPPDLQHEAEGVLAKAYDTMRFAG